MEMIRVDTGCFEDLINAKPKTSKVKSTKPLVYTAVVSKLPQEYRSNNSMSHVLRSYPFIKIINISVSNDGFAYIKSFDSNIATKLQILKDVISKYLVVTLLDDKETYKNARKEKKKPVRRQVIFGKYSSLQVSQPVLLKNAVPKKIKFVVLTQKSKSRQRAEREERKVARAAKEALLKNTDLTANIKAASPKKSPNNKNESKQSTANTDFQRRFENKSGKSEIEKKRNLQKPSNIKNSYLDKFSKTDYKTLCQEPQLWKDGPTKIVSSRKHYMPLTNVFVGRKDASFKDGGKANVSYYHEDMRKY